MKKVIGYQGEIRITEIDAIPPDAQLNAVERGASGFVISHSENGNHHILSGGNVMERTDNVPTGIRILYAILDEPQRLYQDAAVPHDAYDLKAKFYEFRTRREFNPFTEQARRVAD